jgi:hypothetical protein
MPDFNEDQFFDPGEADAIAKQLTHRERALRDLFAKEYLSDYDALAAAIRIGYGKSYAQEYAVRFMNCPYVLQQIQKLEKEATGDDPDVMRNMVRRGLIREAHYRGPGATASARVAAFAKLAELEGLNAPKKTINEMTGPDGQPLNMGGVFVVPGVCSVEEWEAAAAKQQEDLVSGKTEQVAQIG